MERHRPMPDTTHSNLNQQPLVAAAPRGQKPRTATCPGSQMVVETIVCLALLALTTCKSYSQQPVPRDFGARTRQQYNLIAEPEVTYQQYLRTATAEYQRQAQLRSSPLLRYQPAIGHMTPCGNGDFEAGLNNSEWQGAYGSVPGNGDPDFTSFTTGIVSGALTSGSAHQTLVGPGTDPTVGIPLTAPGSTHAVRIGNAVAGWGSELLSKTFNVTPAQSLISFWYAAVFEDPGHLPYQQPSFWVRITDTASGTVIPNLVNLGNGSDKIVADGANPFFQTKPGAIPVLYKDWSCAQINLSQQVGRTVTIEFVTEDCAQGGHYGYAYLDNFCGNCAGSPTGSVTFSPKQSTNCGPGTLCFSYALPKVVTAAGTVTGSTKIMLDIYQNGAFVASLPSSPTLTSGSTYCFPINPSAIPGLNPGLGYFDFVATATFALGSTTLAPMTVGTAPTGMVAGLNNDYKIVCGTTTTGVWCCPGPNLLQNGDLSAGNTGFTSQYTFSPTVSLGATLPGHYNIVTGTDALAISPNWLVADHSTCSAGSGKFMVVNGRTCQTGSKSIWKETVPVTAGKEYRFCANVKNLRQCTFDVNPIVRVQLSIPGTTIPAVTTVVNVMGSQACNWQLISFSSTAPVTAALTIDIQLDETGLGDGNDLALDDISLQEKVQADASLVQVDLATSHINATQYNVSAKYPPGLPLGYGYWWQVCQLDNSNNPIPGTTVSNPSAWWTYPGTTPFFNTFNGYNGTIASTTLDPQTTPPTPGIFDDGKRYRISFGVWSDCRGWRGSSWILQVVPGLATPQITPIALRMQEITLGQALPPLPLGSKDPPQG